MPSSSPSQGGPMYRATFSQQVWLRAAKEAGLQGVTFHTLRHRFVAILVAAGCNVREVSEWGVSLCLKSSCCRESGLVG
jgi:integrase